ncbi:MAG TPA: phosphoribosylformylglycinamidine synthase subunit PurS, partial [Thermoleophilaceae bacterium]|nr:phosphoribosylformylglycinamidine synthase subunit PurS [Thermoleophilaceae bacterium]
RRVSRFSTVTRARVLIRPKQGILDPQGQTVERALPALGFEGVESVHVGRLVELEVADDERVAEMCEQLLANPLGVGRLELDEATDVHRLDALETERGERTLHGLALRVEDALLGTDEDADLQPTRGGQPPAAPVRSSHASNGSPVMRS